MAQATLPSSATIPGNVAAKLRGLRLKITSWLMVDGLSRVLLCLIALVAVDLAIDWWFSLDIYQRIIMLVLSGGILAFVIYRRLLVPLSIKLSDDALCLAVEKHYGTELGESLISAVQFSRERDSVGAHGVSKELVEAAIQQGTLAADRVSFGRVLNSQWFVANMAMLLVSIAILAAGGVAVYATETGKIWWERNVLLGDRSWPQDTYFDVRYAQDDVLFIPRGDDYAIVVTIKKDSKRRPEGVLLDFVSSAGRRTEEMEVVKNRGRDNSQPGAAPNSNEMPNAFRLEMKNVMEPFQFRIRSRKGRGRTAWYQAKLVDRPAVEKLTLTKIYPAYADMEVTLEAPQDKDQIASGTAKQILVKQGAKMKRGDPLVVLQGEMSSRTVASPVGGNVVRVLFETGDELFPGAPLLTVKSVEEELPPGTGPYHVLAGSRLQIRGVANKPLSKATLSIGDSSVDMKITAENVFAADIPAEQLKAGSYRIELIDTEKIVLPGRSRGGPLESKRPTRFTLRVKEDRGPDVVAKLIGISGMVVPQAIIPFGCFIKDEFAVTGVALKYQWRHEENAADSGEGGYDVAAAQDMLGERILRFDDAFDLQPLMIPAGSGLSFHIAAQDNNDVSGPGEGQSTVFLLRVVSEDELRTDLLRREKEQRQDFERLLKNQDQLLTDAQAMLAGIREMTELDREQRQELMKIQKEQKLLATNMNNIASRLTAIVIEVQNNRLEDEGGRHQQRLLDQIINPMRTLAEQDVPEVIGHLDESRHNDDQIQRRNEALSAAIAKQEQIAAAMREILRHMVKAEGYQEAVNLLYEVQKSQEQVHDLTDKKKQQRIQEILERGGDLPPEEKPADDPEDDKGEEGEADDDASEKN